MSHFDQTRYERLMAMETDRIERAEAIAMGMPIQWFFGWWKEPEFTMDGDDVPELLPPPNPNQPDVVVTLYKDISTETCLRMAKEYETRIRHAAVAKALASKKAPKGVVENPMDEQKREDDFSLRLPTELDLKKSGRRIK